MGELREVIDSSHEHEDRRPTHATVGDKKHELAARLNSLNLGGEKGEGAYGRVNPKADPRRAEQCADALIMELHPCGSEEV